MARGECTHKHEESVDVVGEIRYHVLVVAENALLDEIPALESVSSLRRHNGLFREKLAIDGTSCTHLRSILPASLSYRRHRARYCEKTVGVLR